MFCLVVLVLSRGILTEFNNCKEGVSHSFRWEKLRFCSVCVFENEEMTRDIAGADSVGGFGE
ncbi:hypothetical protein GCM10027046_35430 [Uliginosibacterium flavum]